MDKHETQLLDRLKDYYQAKIDMEKAIIDIEEILLLYEFDIDEVSQHYPVIREIYNHGKKRPVKKIRANL